MTPGAYNVKITATDAFGHSAETIVRLTVLEETQQTTGGAISTTGNTGSTTTSTTTQVDQRLDQILNTYSTVT